MSLIGQMFLSENSEQDDEDARRMKVAVSAADDLYTNCENIQSFEKDDELHSVPIFAFRYLP